MSISDTNIFGWQSIEKYLNDDQATRLTERDVVIVQNTNSAYTKQDKESLTMLLQKCNNSGAQFCRYLCLDGQPDIRDIDIIHWRAPFKDPRDEVMTEYYMNEIYYGMGKNAVDKIIAAVATKKTHYLIFARSRYATDGSWGPYEVPFWSRRQQLKSTLQKLKIEVLQLDYHDFGVFPDFIP